MTSEFLDAPAAEQEAASYRGRRRTPVWVALVVAVTLVLALAAMWGVHRVMAQSFPASDSRACAGSTEPLEQKAHGVGLVLPDNARHLQYFTPGADRLMVSFSIDDGDLQRWLSANRLPALGPDYSASMAGPPCGDLEDGFSDPSTSETLLPSGDRLQVSVDPTGVPAAPHRPTVLAQVTPPTG